jgi:hypothetical protein
MIKQKYMKEGFICMENSGSKASKWKITSWM